jgi:hypothetical protein
MTQQSISNQDMKCDGKQGTVRYIMERARCQLSVKAISSVCHEQMKFGLFSKKA